MFHSLKIGNRARQIAVPVIGAFVIGYFSYHSLKGDHGLSAYLSLSAEVAKAEIVLANRVQTRQSIEHRTTLLRPDNLDLDILDERSRSVLNVIEADERVILD